jgi:hypothetical protein
LALCALLVVWRLRLAVVDDDVDAAFCVLLEGLVVVAWLGIFGDYVPGVDGAGDLRGVSVGGQEE